ncbi:MAG: aminopeptidase P family protein [Candidatus Omnitrophica bacterium]|nr:aminopeptidase P family protein [Candidatus Omnitrophota bacterium]
MSARIEQLRLHLKINCGQGILVSHPINITYLTNFISSDSYLLITSKECFLITDSRYIKQAHRYCKGIGVYQYKGHIFEGVSSLVKRLGVKNLAFEAKQLPFAEYEMLKKQLRAVKFIPTYDLIETQRMTKTPGELKKIKKAVEITQKALGYIKRVLREGVSEIEIATKIEHRQRLLGGTCVSFPVIVASGLNSSFPHHITGKKKLKLGQPLFIDAGVQYDGYKSDLTRVFFLGKMPAKVIHVFDIVQQAQELAIRKIRPGVKISEIDQVARQHIANSGYGSFFGHNLGHGIGLEIHELPHISKDNHFVLKPGMVFTLEPAIYLPNQFGIRIEDDVLVTEGGCEVLSGGYNEGYKNRVNP